MGTNACENAPSANMRRSRLGRRNATKKASVIIPAPKARAMTKSRTKPRMRDRSVMPLTVASARSRFIVRGWVPAAARQRRDDTGLCAELSEMGRRNLPGGCVRLLGRLPAPDLLHCRRTGNEVGDVALQASGVAVELVVDHQRQTEHISVQQHAAAGG